MISKQIRHWIPNDWSFRRRCNPWFSMTRARRSPTTSGCTPAIAFHSSGAQSGRQIPSRWRISHPPAMEALSRNPSLSSQAKNWLPCLWRYE